MAENRGTPDITTLPELATKAMRVTMGVHIQTVPGESKHRKVGTNYPAKDTRTGESMPPTNGFEFYSDEPAVLGGDDAYPQPLTYVAAGVGF